MKQIRIVNLMTIMQTHEHQKSLRHLNGSLKILIYFPNQFIFN